MHQSPQLVQNRYWRASAPFVDVEDVLPSAYMQSAAEIICGWPEYSPTPLRNLAGFAHHLDVGQVLCKDEGQRFGMGGVKALGAPYALIKTIADDDRLRGTPIAILEAVAATDGNHGLALAWAMGRLGGRSRIFVGQEVDAPRIARLRGAGAEIELVDGTYDDAVEAAEFYAKAESNRLLVTDTDYDGSNAITRFIMAGYSVLGRELLNQFHGDMPTHIFLQCGVGGMAAGALCGLWDNWGRLDARVILVEPLTAACLQASIAAGREQSVGGLLSTRMVGLSCGRPSRPAWQILRTATFAALSIEETIARRLQQDLHEGAFADPPLLAGDTGIAGLAGLLTAVRYFREELGLNASSRILCINSEAPLPLDI